MTGIQVMETLGLVSPLGLRFWDAVDEAPVSAGLSVTIWPAAQPELRTAAVVNRSGIFSFCNLPGLRAVESGSGDDAFWAAQTPRFDFVVEVTDGSNRFLPFRLPVKLPVCGLGDFIPLFSSPARTMSAPMGLIRAQLFDPIRNGPAAWVLVEARVDGVPAGRGLSDAQGGLLVPLPYPEAHPGGPVFGSPPSPGGLKLTDQTWTVDLSFFYSPQEPAAKIPDLNEVLGQGPTTPLTTATLRFGQELVLRSRGLSTLLITPAGSPP
jgi:hypothetical protein